MSRSSIKSLVAEAAIGGNRFVKFGAADYGALLAAAASDLIVGVSDLTAATGEDVDVTMAGPAELILGGAVTRGQKLTSDANGAGVAAAPAAGTNNQIGAVALISGVAGDIIPVHVVLTTLQG